MSASFDDFVYRFDEGHVDESVIDELLEILYPDDTDARAEHRSRVIVDGVIAKFPAVGLNKRAQTAWAESRVQQPQPLPELAPIPDLPPEFKDDLPDDVYEHPDYVPQIKSRVGIITAVRMWGKHQAQIKDNRTEGVKVRCPFSHHVDNRPSAWVNTTKSTWYCGKCQVGGDVIDFFAAARHGLQPSDFHRSKQFAQIVQEMADELGIRVVSTPDGGFVVETDPTQWASNQPDVDAEPDAESRLPQVEPTLLTEQTPEGPVSYEQYVEPLVPPSSEASEPITISAEDMIRGVEMPQVVDDGEDIDERDLPFFDWAELGVPEGTFLHSWMTQAVEELDWVPQEYFLGLGFQAISMACGHSTTSMTFGMPLNAATLYVLVGDSASGKSTAAGRLSGLIRTATGAKWNPDLGTGVKQISSVASAEALMSRIKTEIRDINNITDPPREVPSNAWYMEDELAQFISRSRRQGGEHIKQRVMRFHDFTKTKDTPEIAVEDYSQTGGYKVVHDSFFTGTFTTQTESLRSLVERNDLVSGFFNRMNFWMGPQRHRRLISKVVAQDPNPQYIKLYERMWKDCQLAKRIIPFSDDSLNLIDYHPLNDRLDAWVARSPMFARWQITMLRLSFMLAVNENSPLVEPRHVNAAYTLVLRYLIPCGDYVIESVKKPEKNIKSEIASEIVTWAEKYFDKKGEWPESRAMKRQRWWRSADDEDRNRAKQLCEASSDIAEVILVDGPWGAGHRTITVVPTGDFELFYGCTGKTYKHADFYDGRRVR